MTATTLLEPWPSPPSRARLIGLVPLAAGTVLAVGHAKLFADVETNIKTFDDPDKLVQSGAFAWTRNPMYLGFTLLLLGAGALLGSLVALPGAALFFVAADRWYIPFEERRLKETFGRDYINYQSRVNRWIGTRP